MTGLSVPGGAGRSYALLADGTTMTIRPPGAEDHEAVKRLHEAMSTENLYFRFFSASRVSAEREAQHPAPGRTGVIAQSGGVGAALLEQFSRLGMGISCFASLGGRLDVSGTDMLLWLESGSTTELAVLHLESFDNPRRFAQVARRVGARIPILTVHAGRSAPDQRAAVSHTAAATAPLITRQALFEQAGIIATSSFGELLDAAVLMSSQPLPAGSTVAIVSNDGGAATEEGVAALIVVLVQSASPGLIPVLPRSGCRFR